MAEQKATETQSSDRVPEPRYFEFIEGNSSKFWEVSVRGRALTTRWGRIGANGQTKTRTLDSPETAQSEARY